MSKDLLTTTKNKLGDQASDLALQIEAIAKAVVTRQRKQLTKAEETISIQTLEALSQLLTTVESVLYRFSRYVSRMSGSDPCCVV
jgi:hypothetical protein